MTETLVSFNAYGSSNKQGPALARWLDRMNVDVAFVCEADGILDDLKTVGPTYHGNDSHGAREVAIVLPKGKADEHDTVQLTRRVVQNPDKPNLTHDRWYTRVRVRDRVYYSVHQNAAIQDNDGTWRDVIGARVTRDDAIPTLKDALVADKKKGYRVRVAGDMNWAQTDKRVGGSIQAMFDDLGFSYVTDKLMWVAWDPDKDSKVKSWVTDVAPGADAHKTVHLTLEPKSTPNTPTPPAPKTKTYMVSVVTSNLNGVGGTKNQVADANWIAANMKPDIWGLQETSAVLGDLRKIAGYGVALPKGRATAVDRSNLIMFNESVYRHQGSTIHKLWSPEKNLLGLEITEAHLQHLDTGDSTYVYTTRTYAHVEANGMPSVKTDPHSDHKTLEAVKNHLTQMAKLIEARAKAGDLVFWTGDFNIDEDADKQHMYPGFKAKIFSDHGLVSVYEELKTPASFDTLDSRKVDAIGTHKSLKRVSAKSVMGRSGHSSHRFVEAIYEVKSSGEPVRGTATDPTVEAPDTVPAKQTAQKDTGSTIDHTNCCGGEYA